MAQARRASQGFQAAPAAVPGAHAASRAAPLAAALALAAGLGCPQETAPEGHFQSETALAVSVSPEAVPADGVSSAQVIARLQPEGTALTGPAVVRFTATGGLLSSSAAPLVEGQAEVTLIADVASTLGQAPSRAVTVRAVLELGDEDTHLSGTAEVTFEAPADEPALFVVPAEAAVPADGMTSVVIEVRGRALDEGTVVALTTTGGALSSSEAPLAAADDDDGLPHATFVLTAPDAPGAVTLTARVASDPEGPLAQAVVDAVPLDGPQFDLTGTWASLAVVRLKLSAGTLTPNPQCAVAPSVQRVEMVQQGEQVSMVFTTCAVVLPPVHSIAGEVTNETPPSFLSAIPEVEAMATLDSQELGATLDPPETLVVVGAQLQNPGADELPTDPDDPRARDDDADGEPGVTVYNSLAGEQHITYRNRGDQVGRVVSSNRIDGSQLGDLTAITETSVLGFGNSFIPDTTPLPSVVQTVRVDGLNSSVDADLDGDGQISCQEILDLQPQIFDLATPSTPLDCGGL